MRPRGTRTHRGRSTCWLVAALIASLGTAWGQANGPHIGYVYPAGGRQGAAFRVTVGGQFLRGADDVYVSGDGVSASVIEYVRPLNNGEIGDAARYLHDLVKKHWSVRALASAAKQAEDMPLLPDHPWLRDLDHKSPAELARLRTSLLDPKKQPNSQIAEQVEIEVAIEPGAAPGDRELRLATPAGLTNPVRFQVGVLPEVREEDVVAPADSAPPLDLPVLLNGQIMPGAVDRFRLRARKGQQLVIRMAARRLIPYLADAVPGWFQATMALYDPQGNELACDDSRYDPDPVLLFKIPQDGVYGLEVRDALYRGRDDFVYRIAVGELPYITQVFPLGGQTNVPTVASIAGWNLPAQTLQLATRLGGDAIRLASVTPDNGLCNQVSYTVDALPESAEAEPNDTPAQAQQVTLPLVINGRIARPGDVDVFRFDAQEGQEVVAEVVARRLGSPLDSALRLVDSTGALVASNDDFDDPAMGLITHHADSYLRVKLPKTGTYWVFLSDAQRQGGDAYAYRLRLGPPQPDFALRLTPSSLSMSPGRSAQFTVLALRKDGFAGDIDVVLRDAPAGFTLNSGRIPGGQDSAQMTLNVPRDAPRHPFPLRLEGRAQIGGIMVSHPAVPAEDMMQAFAYRHLVPQQELLVAIAGSSRPVPAVWRPLVAGFQLASGAPVQIPLGGSAQVQVKAPPILPAPHQPPLQVIRFTLPDPPRGITLRAATVTPAGVTLTLNADANIAQAGRSGNAIVEASFELDADRPGGQPSARKRRLSLGVLPPIPYQVVRAGPQS